MLLTTSKFRTLKPLLSDKINSSEKGYFTGWSKIITYNTKNAEIMNNFFPMQ